MKHDAPAQFPEHPLSAKRSAERVKDYAMLLLDPKGIITGCNSVEALIRGYSAEEIIGQHFSCLYTVEDIAAGKPDQALRQAAAKGYFEETDYRLRKDGSRFIAHIIFSAIIGRDGTLEGFGKITHDITDILHAEQQIEASEKQLT